MSLSVEEIRENYKKFPDYKIEKLATESAFSLRPEVIQILKDEIKKRNLNPNLLNSVTIQREPISEKEIESLTLKIIKAPCPSCTYNKEALIGIQVFETVSPLVISINTERIYIACPSCTKKESKNSILRTLLLGWWSPWGLFYYAPKALINSFLGISKLKENSPLILDAFVSENIGRIKAIEDSPVQLSNLLKKHNSTT